MPLSPLTLALPVSLALPPPLALPVPLALLGASAPARSAGPDLGRYLVLSAVLILAIGGLAWGFKKLVAKSVRVRAGKRSLQVLDVLPLGGKQRLCVVRVYDRVFALGVGDHGVAQLAELDPVLGEEAEHARARASFDGALAEAAQDAGARPEPTRAPVLPDPRPATPRARSSSRVGVLA